jgi:hypothetical protein
MKKEINKRLLLETIIGASYEVMSEDDLIHALIDNYEEHKDISWLLYDLVDAGYDSDELGIYGFDSDDIERMANRSMHGLGPE